MTNNTNPRTIKSVAQTTNIIKLIRELQGATVSELTERVPLSQPSVHTHLATLKLAGFVVQDGHTYDLGPQMLTLGEYVRNRSDLYQASKDQVEKLARETGECAHLGIEHNGQMFYPYEHYGSEAVGAEYHEKKREGPLDHLHCTGTGKCILASMSDDEVHAILDERGMTQYTRNTIIDRDILFEELDEVRERGHAYGDQEFIHGIRAVGKSIVGPDGDVAGAIAVTGPVSRLQGERFEEELPQQVINAANVCEVNLQTVTYE
ncbi:transcriptional regulator (plasmid) [Salinigranum rubrum]|uniref:Transcriptional regulator n=1 Tax=Salinigranum rubrum TaxID=755307 RepID=A0A2I8VQF9_9EURY|nr:IclR family transcriptional regulator [Salinigranum rubrum]AUV84163.1 transcriptional regulator [Salinigranum rubrum]